MKQLILTFVIILGIVITANGQSTENKEKNEKQKMELKDHTCTDACHTSGCCVYAHGEKGHTCTAACKTASTEKMEMTEHVCTDACKDGNHMYIHGEKGHVCTEACKKKS